MGNIQVPIFKCECTGTRFIFSFKYKEEECFATLLDCPCENMYSYRDFVFEKRLGSLRQKVPESPLLIEIFYQNNASYLMTWHIEFELRDEIKRIIFSKLKEIVSCNKSNSPQNVYSQTYTFPKPKGGIFCS